METKSIFLAQGSAATGFSAWQPAEPRPVLPMLSGGGNLGLGNPVAAG